MSDNCLNFPSMTSQRISEAENRVPLSRSPFFPYKSFIINFRMMQLIFSNDGFLN